MAWEPTSLGEEKIEAAKHGMRAKVSPLIRVASDGAITYAQTLADKRALVAECVEGDRLIWPWGGEWSTTVFELDRVTAEALL